MWKRGKVEHEQELLELIGQLAEPAVCSDEVQDCIGINLSSAVIIIIILVVLFICHLGRYRRLKQSKRHWSG